MTTRKFESSYSKLFKKIKFNFLLNQKKRL